LSDWRPIDTAPRDGTRIVLYLPDWPACPIARWEMIPGMDGDSLWVLDDETGGCHDDGMLWPDDDGEPTHWTVIPA
jgi:hypothetical protein